MTTYTSIFGGNSVRPADQSLTVIALTSNQTLSWPQDGGTPATSAIVEVTPDTGGRTLSLPDARRAGAGETVTFKNFGSVSFSVLDNAGGSVVTIAAGLIYTVYLRDNSTAAGSWTYWQAGAGTSVADASALKGAGLDALSGLLRVKATSSSYATSQAFSDGDRGGIATWTGGSGTFSMPRASSVGNGWYMVYKNAGSGTLQIAATNSETFDGGVEILLSPNDGATVYSNGTNFSFVKHGTTSSGSSYSYTSISVAGSGTYTLSATEYAKSALNFTGLLTGNRTIVVPTAVQAYTISNNTTGAFTLTVKTAAGSGIAVTQTKTQGVYCDGTNVVSSNSDYPSGLSTPISVANGGTGATTAGAALTNLGATATGSSVFTAANAAAGRSAISAAATGANTDITGVALNNTGLTVRDTDASNFLTVKPGSNLTADRIFTLTTGDAARTLDISAGDVTITTAGAALTSGANAAAQRTTLGLGSAALLTAGTAANNAVQLNASAQLPAVDGSLLTGISASGRLLRAPQILTSGTSYTTPAGCNSVYVELVGGGGGSGGRDSSSNSGGGGGGGYCAKFATVSPSTSYTIAIGLAGTAGASGASGNGGAGGSTTITIGGTTYTATGGSGSNGSSATSGNGGAGGSATNGDINNIGIDGYDAAGSSVKGAPSFFGLPTATKTTATQYGCGGGGSGGIAAGVGFAGFQGAIRVWEYS
jgi:hypothetical protein